MSAELTLDAFEPHVGERFSVRVPGAEQSFEFELDEALDASARMRLPAEFRSPFRLSFYGPPDVVLPQGTYELEHPAVGRFTLFMVPVMAPRKDGRQLHEVIVA